MTETDLKFSLIVMAHSLACLKFSNNLVHCQFLVVGVAGMPALKHYLNLEIHYNA